MPLSEARASVQESLERLSFVPDLYLIHNPYVAEPGHLKELWALFETLKDEGKLKSIGVSNFRPQDLEVILDGAKYKPVVNHVRCALPLSHSSRLTNVHTLVLSCAS